MRKANVFMDYSLLKELDEVDILLYYFEEIKCLPCLISSPYRVDSNPSLSISYKYNKVMYHDFATNDSGGLYKLLSKTYSMPINEVKNMVVEDFRRMDNECVHKYVPISECRDTDIKVKKRDWNEHDTEFWKSYGIDINWISKCNVYPISHFFINNNQYVADRYAYAYFEFKDDKPTCKIYQPLNKHGFKWRNNHDKSVISLWNRIPKKGELLFICSSVKDALCLTCNTKYPAVALQSENCTISKSALRVITSRFNKIYILLDNDEAGINNSIRLSKEINLEYLVLPRINGAKDISDLYKSLDNKDDFKTIINNMIYGKNDNV